MGDDSNDKFLSRWSRLKRDAKVAPSGAALGNAAPAAAEPLQRQEEIAAEASPMPQLPPVDELTMDSDFSGFFHPKVAQNIRHEALKKLFSDPHFNVMDGLDTYIDDYSIPNPLPAEMLAQMRSAQKIFKWARDELEEGETVATPTPTPEAAQAALVPEVPEVPLAQPLEPSLVRAETAQPVAPGKLAPQAASPRPAVDAPQPAAKENS